MAARRDEFRARVPRGSVGRWESLTAPLLLLLLAGAPASQPATKPAAADLRRAVADLASTDAPARDAARTALLGLPPGRLPELVAAVKQARPLLPSQAQALRDVVKHVYISGLPYERENRAFLGIKMAPEDEVVRVQVPGAPEGETEDRRGVVVTYRWPGFAGYRWLLEGDVIVRVEEFPPDANGQVLFRNYVSQLRPGERITMHVLRQGQIVRVPVTLSARPPVPMGGELDAIELFAAAREAEADQFWAANFASAVE